MNTINKSLRLLQLEKMVIILKEMEHIDNIFRFYEGYKEESDNQKKPIKKNIKFLKQDIENLRTKIKIIKNINQHLYNQDLKIYSSNVLFIVQYDYIRTQIEDMLRVIQALYNKMGQLFGEALNQYIPYPILGRRYSNNTMMMYLENYYRKMLDLFSDNTDYNENTPQLILGWNYRTGFQYRTFVNRDIKRDNYKDDTYNNYIDLPYWYYELPFLLPSITHEVIHIALRNPEKKLKKIYDSLNVKLEDFFEDTSNDFVQKIQDIIGYKEYTQDLTKEIICDLYGYKIHKESYIYALFHNVIGEKLAQDYLKIIHGSEKNNKTKKIEKCNLLANDWFFLQKKDHAILRLHFLLKIHSDKTTDNKEFNQMQNLLDSIMPLKKSKTPNSGFEYIYTYNYPNFKPSYESVQNYLMQLLECLNIWFSSIKNEIKLEEMENSPDFNKIWQQRFKQMDNDKDIVPHQNNFRRHLKEKISDLEYIKNNENEKLAYLLTLKKIRKDEKSTLKNKISTLIKNNINSDTQSYVVYGIYDNFSLQNKANVFNVSDMLNALLTKKQEEGVRYFDTKQVLTKVSDTITTEKAQERGDFSAVINIEILKNINNPDCYENLKSAVEEIEDTLHNNKSKFLEADIFTSLGPKDITVLIKNSTLANIFHLTNELNQSTQIMRTFTMICSKASDDFDLPKEIGDGFRIVSTLRLCENAQEFSTTYNHYLTDKSKIYDIVETTGVMDINIIWNTKDMNEVFEFYDKLIENSIVTDFQTKIEKVLN